MLGLIIGKKPAAYIFGSLLITCSLVSPFALAEQAQTKHSDDEKTLKTQAQLTSLPLEELRTFVEVFDHIRKAYVNPISDSELLENAIIGMLHELDPHSSYLDPESLEDLKVGTQGEFGGLGIEIDLEDSYIRVITPIDDTPAAKAGIEAGDLIVKINGKPVKGMKLNEGIDMMRGEIGTDIILTIIRNETENIDITVTRGIIEIQSVKGELLDPGFAYIRIAQFQTRTTKDLLAVLAKLSPPEAPLKGIVLDLRNNPGGLLSAAVGVVDAFISEGMIVYTAGRDPSSKKVYSATKTTPAQYTPVAILINGGSASASEIVAGSLQDHKRAVIMGTASFGKGSVQTIFPLGLDKAVKLTTALYYTPKGRSIQAQGIEPDIIVAPADVKTIDSKFTPYRESDLTRHLANSNPAADANTSTSTESDSDSDTSNAPTTLTKNAKEKSAKPVKISLVERDFQLYEALNLLKGMHILSGLKKLEPANDPKPKLKDVVTKSVN
ncbi:MAG: S41 family peptidase [Pseudomonadales bacterium]|nr:S41 family peptidase [Pseudomonadales bacterium]